MLELLQSVLALVVTVSILVVFHEYGHYQVARWFGVRVLRFSVGFGPALLRWTPAKGKEGKGSQDGTEFVLAAIPLGGYVQFLDGRTDEVPDEERHLAFDAKPVWPRIAIVAAGPLANFILAFFAYWLLFSTGVGGLAPLLGQPAEDSPAARSGFREGEEIVAVDGRETRTWQTVHLRLLDRMGESGSIEFTLAPPNQDSLVQRSIAVTSWQTDAGSPGPAEQLGLRRWQPPLEARVASLVEGGRAEAAGLLPNDLILAVSGQPIDSWYDLVELVQASPGVPLQLSLHRGQQQLQLEAVPELRLVEGAEQGFLGIAPHAATWPPDSLRKIQHPVYSAWLPAGKRTWELSWFTVESLGKMVAGAISFTQLSGPVTIASVARMAAESGFESYISLLALLSIAIGVLNLMPIPVLDGGHLLYYGVEAAAGRPLPERIQTWGRELGLTLVAALMLLALFNDLMRL